MIVYRILFPKRRVWQKDEEGNRGWQTIEQPTWFSNKHEMYNQTVVYDTEQTAKNAARHAGQNIYFVDCGEPTIVAFELKEL